MPFYGPDGRELPPSGGVLVGAPKLSDFPPLSPFELQQLRVQLTEGLASGHVREDTPVTVPTGVLLRLVRLIELLASGVAAPSAPADNPVPTPDYVQPLPPVLAEMLEARKQGA